jgi:UDP-GlcNAc:undecaprenyl-phosphate/decaprenyl-phosphate GlcNAc-1-phosphate transferase
MEAIFWSNFIVPAILAAVVSSGITALITRWGSKLKIVDDPKTHNHPKVVHDKPVPRGGGWPIWVALVVGVIAFSAKETKLWGIVAGATILALTGFLDDRFSEKVSPYLRLLLNGLAALCVIGVGIGIAYITNPWGGVINLDTPRWCFGYAGSTHCIWILSDLFALVWLIWMQNIVGWSSGVDGQLSGFVITAAVTMALLAMRFGTDSSQLPVLILAGITTGAFAGFLPWNWFPQKIMPGYGGKSLAGFLLGTLAILSAAKVGALLLVLGLPVIDAVLVIIKRIKEGRSPVWGGREHLHHYLLDAGWGKRRIAIFYWGVSIVLAVFAWQLKAPLKLFTMAAIALLVTGAVLWLKNWSTSLKQPGRDNG